MTTEAEQQALKEIEAAQARGEDVFGDEEELVRDEATEEVTDQADQSEASTEQPSEEQANEAPADEQTLEEIANEAQPESVQLPSYKAEIPTDYKAQRAELLKAKAEAMKQLMDGEIDPEAFAATEADIAEKLEDLTAQRIRAETLQEANVQNQQAYQQREIQKLIRRTTSEIDYTKDASAAKQFDQALAVISSDPDNSASDFAELIDNAHKIVMAMRGLKATPAKPGPRKPDAEAPVTLRNLPAASVPNTNGGVIEQMSRLKGAAYEAAFSKLSPTQRASLLDEATE